MRIFISSLITGLEPLRAAAREAVTTLRHEATMAEDFGAQPHSPQVACLTGVRQADLVVLIMGESYGAVQSSGRSATHEEYEEAKGRKPVIAFVQEGVQLEPQQAAFVREVQGWADGLFRGSFQTADELRRGITRALYDYALTNATGPVDHEEMMQRAVALLPTDRRNRTNAATLNLAIAGGPRQSMLRPVEIEKPTLTEALMQRALFGEHRLMDLKLGVNAALQGAALVVQQERGPQILLDEQGSVVICLPVKRSGSMMMELIYEVISAQLTDALDYAAWVLDHIDPTERLTHIALAVNLTGAEHMAWRTQSESDASPNRISVSTGNNQENVAKTSRTRPALRMNAAHIVEDLIVPLRRLWR